MSQEQKIPTDSKKVEHQCSICQMDISKVEIMALECCHLFHANCIDEYHKNNVAKREVPCPNCRTLYKNPLFLFASSVSLSDNSDVDDPLFSSISVRADNDILYLNANSIVFDSHFDPDDTNPNFYAVPVGDLIENKVQRPNNNRSNNHQRHTDIAGQLARAAQREARRIARDAQRQAQQQVQAAQQQARDAQRQAQQQVRAAQQQVRQQINVARRPNRSSNRFQIMEMSDDGDLSILNLNNYRGNNVIQINPNARNMLRELTEDLTHISQLISQSEDPEPFEFDEPKNKSKNKSKN